VRVTRATISVKSVVRRAGSGRSAAISTWTVAARRRLRRATSWSTKVR